MKRLLLFSILSILCFTISAQTNTWTGSGANDNWNTTLNWSLNTVPTAAHNVVIPTGFNVNLNVAGITKSITIQGNSTFNITKSLSFTNASTFGVNTTIVFSDGDIKGGGVLTNNGTINMATSASKYIYNNTVLNNLGTINYNSTGILYINDGTLNNQASGVIDLRTAAGNISYTGGSTHKLNNYGLIKRTSTTGDVSIVAELHNDGGTIQVETGSLIFNFGLIKLSGGIYNVSTDASLNWISTVTCEGDLTGSLDGPIKWIGMVSVPTTAKFNFSGNTGVDWIDGSLAGGGTLTNMTEITNLTNASRYIYDNTILNNTGLINFESTGILYVNDGTINNQSAGVIDLKSDNNNISYTGGSTHVLNNTGLIKRTTTTGTSTITVVLNNNAGTISVSKGTLNLVGLPKNFTNGTYNVVSGSAMLWNSTIVCAGTLGGVLDGEVRWNNVVNVPATTTATFNFTGSTGINWSDGSLTGEGTLVNQSEITLVTSSSKYIYDNTILSNKSKINCESTGVLYINDGTINNETAGIIDLKVDGSNFSYTGGNTHVLNNSGLIKCTVPTGTANLSVLLNNNNGTIAVESGSLIFSTLSKFLNNGQYNVATNASLTSNIQTVLSGTLTGVLDGAILWNSEVNVPTGTTANLNFTGNTGVNWRDGSLNGGGILVNKSEITMISNLSKYIYGDTNLNNEGIINHESDGVLYINDGIINNQPTGVIDLQADGTSLSYTGGATHVINNYGILKRSVTTGVSLLEAQLNNFDGAINVESGILNFSGLVKNLTDGDYNVATGSSLLWNTQIVCAGTLEGLLDGDISWNGEVNVPSTATFNFSGGIGLNWNDGSLNGGGTLINAGELTLLSSLSKYIYSNSNLNNSGLINYESNGVLYINDGTLNNETDGVIDAKFDGTLLSYTGGSTHIFNNAGLLKKSAGTGATAFNTLSTNSGIIDAQFGTLNFVDSFVLNNTTDGIIKGIATIDIPSAANFTNNGTFAPGGSPGTLNVLGNYQSTSTTVIEIELFGLTAGSDYDVLSITGNAIFDGSVNVIMNFDAAIDDEFIVATTTGTISQCSLQPTTTGTFNGSIYTFDVSCRNGNQVVLKVNNITLGSEEITLSSVKLFPNPSNGNFTIDLGREYTDVNVEIYNMLGQLISSEKYASAKTIEQTINTSAGTYFIKINTAKEGSKTLRIIKN